MSATLAVAVAVAATVVPAPASATAADLHLVVTRQAVDPWHTAWACSAVSLEVPTWSVTIDHCDARTGTTVHHGLEGVTVPGAAATSGGVAMTFGAPVSACVVATATGPFGQVTRGVCT